YVQVARAIAHGNGLTSNLTAGVPLVAAYPPGYSALLVPIALVSGSAYAAFRGLSVGLVGVLVPLVWWYLRRRGVPAWAALSVLLLLALNPVLGTFSMMIMAELPFLVLLMGVLFAIDRWASSARLTSAAGVATIVGSAALVWLKEAGAGLVIGFVLWLLLRRDTRRAVALAVGSFALFLPVLVARLAEGVDLLGSRYANEFGFAFRGGVVHNVVHAVSTYANVALPQTVVPTSVSPLPMFGWASVTLDVFGTLTAPLVVIGFVVWWRRHADVMCVAVPVYVATTLVFPYTNERRLILILPFVLAWYVLGWAAAAARVAPRLHAAARPVVWALPLVSLVVLLPQFGRDYLYDLGHGSSRPRSAPYTRLLAALGSPRDLVETDYVWTTSLFTGHRTAPGAFYLARSCAPSALAAGLARDRPSFLLSAALANTPGPGSPCLLAYTAGLPSAVRIFRTAFDDASVFEFVGPGTPHPTLADLTGPVQPAGAKVGIFQALPQGPGDPGGPYPIVTPVGGTAVVTWDWGAPRRVSQVTLGQAFAPQGLVTSVSVQLRGTDGRWTTVASAAGAVGDGGVVPYLLQPLSVTASALRVEVRTAADTPVYLLDTHALGS
ncbi:MAG TPA: hypothetical protein VKR22_05990, partial [Acidimicrobiales bacterium]|nr:hypothetical protein [Acidimicrobiales bacterium]